MRRVQLSCSEARNTHCARSVPRRLAVPVWWQYLHQPLTSLQQLRQLHSHVGRNALCLGYSRYSVVFI